MGLNTYFAMSGFAWKNVSSKPKLVVRTRGGCGSASSVLMMSRKPNTPSWFSLPAVMNVVLTPVARPAVYWISRL